MIWKAGYFQSMRNIVSKSRHSYINSKNYQEVNLELEEMETISDKLKLKKQNIKRVFELAFLAALDQNDSQAKSKFNHDIKKKFYYQMNKDLLYPYFALNLHSYFPLTSSPFEQRRDPKATPKYTCCDSLHQKEKLFSSPMRFKFTPSAQNTNQMLQEIEIKIPDRLRDNLLKVMRAKP